MLFFNKTVFKLLILIGATGIVLSLGAGSMSAAMAGATIGTVSVPALNMRYCPDTSCRIIKILNRGDRLGITGEKGDWLEVVHNGARGYVYGSSAYVRRGGVDISILDESQRKAEEIFRRISFKEDDISRMNREAAEIKGSLETLDRQLASVNNRLQQLEKDSVVINAAMEETAVDIASTRAAINEKKEYAGKRLVALYKLNRLGGMNLLASADSTSDLFRRKAAIEAIVANDEEHISGLVESKKRLEQLYALSAKEKRQRDQLEEDVIETRAELAENKKQREQLLAQIEAEKKKALTEMKQLEEAGQRLAETIAGLMREAEEKNQGGQKIFSEYEGLLKSPVEGKIISRFGKFTEPHSGAASFKNGIELGADSGAPVRAIFEGETSFSDWLAGFGRVIVISHGNSFYSVYGHLGQLFSSRGEKVKANEVIATVGDSGSNTRPFLYFEIRQKGNPLDPLDWIEKIE